MGRGRIGNSRAGREKHQMTQRPGGRAIFPTLGEKKPEREQNTAQNEDIIQGLTDLNISRRLRDELI